MIEAIDLCRTFSVPEGQGIWRAFRRPKTVYALRSVTFTIPAGQRCLIKGTNGSGKSTLLKLITGILRPTAGTITRSGVEPWCRRSREQRHLGAMFGQKTLLFPDLTLRDALDLYRPLYALAPAQLTSSLDELEDFFDFGSVIDTPVRKLSLGQRMKCELVAATFHAPSTLVLDEPTIGLDAATREGLRRYLCEHTVAESGTPVTVILTTHDDTFARQVSTHALSLTCGEVAAHAETTPAEPLQQSSSTVVIRHLANFVPPTPPQARVEYHGPEETRWEFDCAVSDQIVEFLLHQEEVLEFAVSRQKPVKMDKEPESHG